MTRLDRWFLKMIKRVGYEPQPVPAKDIRSISSYGSFNCIIFPAVNGGYAVELSTYNVNTDRIRKELYVVSERANLGKELGSIITQYNLRSE